MMDPDDAVPYNEFIDLARDHGLLGIEVQVLQTPGEANGHAAVVRASARTAQGSFDAVGEAAPDSAPAAWRPFLTTLAELRAKARALRELTGAEHAVREELATPYGPRGEDDEGDEFPPAPLARPAPAYNPPARTQAPQAGPAARPTVVQAQEAPVSTAGDDEDGDADEDAAEVDEPDEVAPRGRAAAAATPPSDDELPPDFEGIGREMEAKLLKLAISIATLEGSDISEAEAREKLDAFFLKAFKHPLSRASRLEGQRVVQRLSSDLSQRRSEANRAGSDE